LQNKIFYERNLLGDRPRQISLDLERDGQQWHLENIPPRAPPSFFSSGSSLSPNFLASSAAFSSSATAFFRMSKSEGRGILDLESMDAKAGSMQRPKMTDAIVEAIKVCGNSKGLASASSIRAMIMTDHPDLPKMVLKKAMTKAIDQGMVTQVKGNGFSGSFKLGKGKPAVKKAADGKKGAKKSPQ